MRSTASSCDWIDARIASSVARSRRARRPAPSRPADGVVELITVLRDLPALLDAAVDLAADLGHAAAQRTRGSSSQTIVAKRRCADWAAATWRRQGSPTPKGSTRAWPPRPGPVPCLDGRRRSAITTAAAHTAMPMSTGTSSTAVSLLRAPPPDRPHATRVGGRAGQVPRGQRRRSGVDGQLSTGTMSAAVKVVSCSSLGSVSGAMRIAWCATAVSNRLRTKRALPKPACARLGVDQLAAPVRARRRSTCTGASRRASGRSARARRWCSRGS